MADNENTRAPAGDERTQFDYLLNAVEHAGQEKHPAKAGYAGKRKALFAYVRDLERRASAPAAAPLPLTEVDIADDEALRFACRVLESEAPEEDRVAARRLLYAIRIRVRKAHAAALAADERSAAVPPAHKLVPLVLTQEMLDAAAQQWHWHSCGNCSHTWKTGFRENESASVYRAMLAASPEVCASGSGERETAKPVAWLDSSGEPYRRREDAWDGDPESTPPRPLYERPPSSEVAAGVPEGAQGQQQGRQGEKA